MSKSTPAINVPMLDGIVRDRMKEAPQLKLAEAVLVVNAQVASLGVRRSDAWKKRMNSVNTWANDMGIYIDPTR